MLVRPATVVGPPDRVEPDWPAGASCAEGSRPELIVGTFPVGDLPQLGHTTSSGPIEVPQAAQYALTLGIVAPSRRAKCRSNRAWRTAERPVNGFVGARNQQMPVCGH